MRIKIISPTLPQWVLLANIAGIILSIFMWRNALTNQVIGCLTGGGCETVLHSPYAKIFGVPVAAYGLAFYGVNALITFFRLVDDRPILRLASWTMSDFGILASLYFLYLEIFVIHAFCSWCTVSTFLTIALSMLAIIEVKKFGGFKQIPTEIKQIFFENK